MFWKKTTAILAAALMSVSLPISVFAQETLTDSPDSALEGSLGNGVGDPLTEGEASTDFYDLYMQMREDLQISSEPLYDISGSKVESTEYLNLQYQLLTESLAENGYGERAEITMPELSMGYSSNIQSVFNETYGDIVGAGMDQLESISLPESFNASDMLSQIEEARNAYASEVMSSEEFQTVKNQISIGNIFSQAQSGVTTPSLGGAPLEERLDRLSSSLDTGYDYRSLVQTQSATNQQNFDTGVSEMQTESQTAWDSLSRPNREYIIDKSQSYLANVTIEQYLEDRTSASIANPSDGSAESSSAEIITPNDLLNNPLYMEEAENTISAYDVPRNVSPNEIEPELGSLWEESTEAFSRLG